MLSMPTPTHPHLQVLFDYWRGLERGRAAPAKRRFDPVALPGAVWPRIFMIDILEGERNYRVRLMGTYIVDAYGCDFTGRPLVDAEVPRITQTATFRLLGDLAATGECQHYSGPSPFRYLEDYSTVEQILMPLADDDGRIAFAVGAADYRERPGFRPRGGINRL